MKHTLTLLLLLALALTSCELETSGNGDLDGFWHLERIDSIEGTAQIDLKNEKLFWSFQHNLLELDDKNLTHPSVLMRFEKNGDMLHLYNPYLYNREEGDEPLTDIAPLLPYGVNGLEDLFTIEQLNGTRLTLASGLVRLHLKKF